jgi:hypothetical protein
VEQKTKKIGSYIKLRLRNQKDGTYGIIDNLSMTLSGNWPVAISDAATPVLTSNTFNFTDNTVSTSGSEYTYDGCGATARTTPPSFLSLPAPQR